MYRCVFVCVSPCAWLKFIHIRFERLNVYHARTTILWLKMTLRKGEQGRCPFWVQAARDGRKWVVCVYAVILFHLITADVESNPWYPGQAAWSLGNLSYDFSQGDNTNFGSPQIAQHNRPKKEFCSSLPQQTSVFIEGMSAFCSRVTYSMIAPSPKPTLAWVMIQKCCTPGALRTTYREDQSRPECIFPEIVTTWTSLKTAFCIL